MWQWSPARTVLPGVLALAVVSWACAPARAELADDVEAFLAADAQLKEDCDAIAADRAAMAADIDNEAALRRDVLFFFAHRADAFVQGVKKAVNRKLMRKDISFEPGKIAKPTPPTGDLQQDAASYIEHYREWKALWASIVQDKADMQTALNRGDSGALSAAVESFFYHHRDRLEARLQFESDLRAMKKAVGFKGTGKPAAPTGTTLKDLVGEFLADRAAWENLRTAVDADREAIEAALSDASALQTAVTTFLTDRRALWVKGREVALDRQAMRRAVGLRGAEKNADKKALKASFAAALNHEDEQGELDETSDSAGEK